ncbi:MAG: hypothetical protein P4L40_12260 [Terracidiphilus sp.]|nr:hypothetical protein [Terracidiphilus sp.]
MPACCVPGIHARLTLCLTIPRAAKEHQFEQQAFDMGAGETAASAEEVPGAVITDVDQFWKKVRVFRYRNLFSGRCSGACSLWFTFGVLQRDQLHGSVDICFFLCRYIELMDALTPL